MAATRDKNIKSLIRGCRKGDKGDWQELISRISPVIFSVCHKFQLSREESFDVFGKVSLMILENLTNLRDEEKIFGYISITTQREASTLKQRSKKLKNKLRQISLDPSLRRSKPFQAPDIEMREDISIMAVAFSKLSSKCRALLQMLFFESGTFSYKQIAEQLEIPVSSIGPTRIRCLEKLKNIMIKQGYVE